MEWLVYVMWNDSEGCHEEYHPFPDLDEAKHYADYKAKRFTEKCENNKMGGFSVLVYELTNY
jgi:hypothetical protein